MADVATATGADGAPEGETPNQRQARLRREKRQKRMAEEGEDRLARIKALNGGIAPPEEALGGPTVAPVPQVASVHDDPDEVDISQNSSFIAAQRVQAAQQAQQQDLLRALAAQRQQGLATAQGGDGAQDDPMMQMMQQMMGAMGGQQGQGGAPQLPPQLQALLNGGGQGGGPGGQAGQTPEAKKQTASTQLWKVVHAIFAITLATYIGLTSSFNGSKLARSQGVYADEASGLGPRLFILFTSAELVLQSSRYFMEGGAFQGPGMFATVLNTGLVPEPYANYIRVGARYIGIAQTIFRDAMIVVFVFGLIAWWQGTAAS